MVRIRPVSPLLAVALLLGGCEDFLDLPPPGQVFEPPEQGDQDLSFLDVAAQAGIDCAGASYGSGWGDVDGDGDVDLWSGNHAYEPCLYLNRGDGAFVESALDWFGEPDGYADLRHDAHGIAIADFDRDGDPDLLEVVGANSGLGFGPNKLHRNEGGRFVESGEDAGLDYPLGSGRCPIVYDWNLDGRLDVALINQPRPDGEAPTALFTQGDDGTFQLQATVPEALQHPTALCGQLADVDGDRVPELVRFGRPSHLSAHDTRSGTFEDVTEAVGLPPANKPYDVVVADFDNDLRNDLFYTRWQEVSEWELSPDARELRMAFKLPGVAQGARFRSTGPVTITLDPPWTWTPDQIHLGAGCQATDALAMTFTAASEEVQGLCAWLPGDSLGLFVGHDGTAWEVVLSSDAWHRGNVVVTGSEPLADLETVDWEEYDDDDIASWNRDRLWMNTEDGWKDEGWNRGIQAPTKCNSVVSGDFDNDGDLDLFLACASQTGNLPNLLLRNDGTGRFETMANHGAEGTEAGRSDTVVVADYDEDGFLDLFVSNGYAAPPFNGGPQELFRNQGNTNHWLELDLVGTTSNREAIGASVVLTTGGVSQLREVGSETHHMGLNHRRVHFGLARTEIVDRIDIRWPDGTVQVLEDVMVDQILEVVEPE